MRCMILAYVFPAKPAIFIGHGMWEVPEKHLDKASCTVLLAKHPCKAFAAIHSPRVNWNLLQAS